MSSVRDILTGRIPVDLEYNQRHALDVLMQGWGEVQRRPELTEGFAELLLDPDSRLRLLNYRLWIRLRAVFPALSHSGLPRSWPRAMLWIARQVAR